MSDVTLKSVRKSYGAAEVIPGIDLDINSGEFCVFVGPSGCGKSTLLRMIAGLEDCSGGEIKIGARDVTQVEAAERGVAMVFQNYALYPHMTIAQNMGFALRIAKRPTSEIEAAVQHAAGILQIEHLLARKPRELSGGQRQRVAIGRAITRAPEVFLFDEPLSNLDAALRVQMRVEIARLHGRLKNTMIYVTHDQIEAMTMADRIVVMNAGRIEQCGAPMELYQRPANLFVAGFIGAPQMNFLEGRINAEAGRATFVTDGFQLPLNVVLPSTPATLGLRPEHLSPCAPEVADFSGRVVVVERLGPTSLVHVELAHGAQVIAIAGGSTTTQAGMEIGLRMEPDSCHIFGQDGQRIETGGKDTLAH